MINIQTFKAEACGVNLYLKMNKFDRQDYNIYSDSRRIQQIILNLLSNAIKFTLNGGSVTIACTYISKKEDLHSQKHH